MDQEQGQEQGMEGFELLLLRHGIAEERSTHRPDHLRPLTAAGRLRTAAVLDRLRALDLFGQLLYSSPLLRARQTAELVVEAGLAPALQLVEGLAPDGDPWPLLQCPAKVRRLVLVGHEPHLGDLAAALIGAPPGALALKKAGIALLRITPADPCPRGQLRLLLGPAQLLAGS